MALQDMVMPLAPGPPAMFVFLTVAVMDHVRDGRDCCHSSIFPCQGFYGCDLECQEAVNLCISYWKSLGRLMIYHLHMQYFFFSLATVHHLFIFLAVCVILWCPVCFICTTFILYTALIPLGGNSPAAFDPTYIFMSSGRPQCSTQGPTAGSEASAVVKGNGRTQNGSLMHFFYLKVFILSLWFMQIKYKKKKNCITEIMHKLY